MLSALLSNNLANNNNEVAIGPVAGYLSQSYRSGSHVQPTFFKRVHTIRDVVAMQSSDNSFRFFVGESFPTYSDLEAKIRTYEVSAYVQLTHRDSRTLEGMKTRAPNRVKEANPQLLYYSIYLSCLFGGKKYKNKGTGQRGTQL